MKSILSDPGHCVIIGEVAQAHDGSLGMAHAFIDAIAAAGADAARTKIRAARAIRTMAKFYVPAPRGTSQICETYPGRPSGKTGQTPPATR